MGYRPAPTTPSRSRSRSSADDGFDVDRPLLGTFRASRDATGSLFPVRNLRRIIGEARR